MAENRASPGPAHVLVVGGGLAALRTCAELRGRGFSGRLTVVAEEDAAPYDRPPLSKALLARDTPSPLADDGLGDLDELADEVMRPARALSIAGADSTDGAEGAREPRVLVALPGGERRELLADAIVAATGARAVLPPALAAGVSLRTWEDAVALRAALSADLPPAARSDGPDRSTTPRSLVVVGAGWIGAEVASVTAEAGLRVTVLEAGPAPLAGQLGAALGGQVTGWFAEAGVDLRLGTAVAGIDRTGRTVQVRLASGEILAADAALVAVGARARTEVLGDLVHRDGTGAALVTPGGRPVDGPSWLRVVGDAATVVLPSGARVPGGHWDAALHHPAAVAADLLGAPADDLPPVPAASTFSTMFGRELLALGDLTPDRARLVLRTDSPAAPGVRAGWTALALDADGRLAGALLVDRPRDAGPLRKALANGARPAVHPVHLGNAAIPLKRALGA